MMVAIDICMAASRVETFVETHNPQARQVKAKGKVSAASVLK